MIQLTEKAVIKAKEIAESEGLALSIRLQVRGGGCSGYVNDMCFDDQINDTDEIIEQDGVKIVIDQMSFQYLDGSIIDYVDSQFAAGFKFINPNATGSCGCGNSVSY